MTSDAYINTQNMKRRKGERSTIVLAEAIRAALRVIDGDADKDPLDTIKSIYSILFEALVELKLIETERFKE
jgi:hypothetical protein